MVGIEGVEYHPRQRKKGGSFKKLWMLPVIFAAAAVVYFLNNETMSKKLDTSLVIIKEPESDTVKINSIPVKARTTTSHPRREEPKILENLDELNRFHKRHR